MGTRHGKIRSPKEDVRNTISECCRHQVPATILVNHADTAMQGRFADILDQTVTFDLFLTEEMSLLPPTLCCVTFCTANRSCVFLAPIHDYLEMSSQPPQLVVGLPPSIVQTEARSVFRTPVWRESGLLVHLWASDEKVWKVEAVHISLGGILVGFPEEDTPDLPVGTQLRAELQFDNHFTTLGAVVQHRSRHHYGLFFPECLFDGKIDPPAEFQTMVDLIEQTWLRRIGRWSSLLTATQTDANPAQQV